LSSWSLVFWFRRIEIKGGAVGFGFDTLNPADTPLKTSGYSTSEFHKGITYFFTPKPS